MEYTVEIQAEGGSAGAASSAAVAGSPTNTIWQTMSREVVDADSAEQAAGGAASNPAVALWPGWRVVVWEGAGADTSTGPVATYGPAVYAAAPTYTAWLTTDRSALNTDRCDVSVLANDPVDGASTGDPVWYAETTVPCWAPERDDDELCRQASTMLEAAGWVTEGTWDAIPTGYLINVTRS